MEPVRLAGPERVLAAWAEAVEAWQSVTARQRAVERRLKTRGPNTSCHLSNSPSASCSVTRAASPFAEQDRLTLLSPTIKLLPLLSGDREVASTMKVLKLLRPGLHRHLTISALSKKEGAIQLASRALLVNSTDKSPENETEAKAETSAEMDGPAELAEERPVMPVSEVLNMCETATLCGEA